LTPCRLNADFYSLKSKTGGKIFSTTSNVSTIIEILADI